MTSTPKQLTRLYTKEIVKIMVKYTEWPLLELLETRSFPSHTGKAIKYGSRFYNQLLNAKTILSLYGYTRHKLFFDIVVKDNLCFNIVSDDNGFYLKQSINEV